MLRTNRSYDNCGEKIKLSSINLLLSSRDGDFQCLFYHESYLVWKFQSSIQSIFCPLSSTSVHRPKKNQWIWAVVSSYANLVSGSNWIYLDPKEFRQRFPLKSSPQNLFFIFLKACWYFKVCSGFFLLQEHVFDLSSEIQHIPCSFVVHTDEICHKAFGQESDPKLRICVEKNQVYWHECKCIKIWSLNWNLRRHVEFVIQRQNITKQIWWIFSITYMN